MNNEDSEKDAEDDSDLTLTMKVCTTKVMICTYKLLKLPNNRKNLTHCISIPGCSGCGICTLVIIQVDPK